MKLTPEELVDQARGVVRRAIAEHMSGVRACASQSQTCRALAAMFSSSIRVLAGMTVCDPEFRTKGRSLVPTLAGDFLLRELQTCAECPEEQLTALSNALAVRRGDCLTSKKFEQRLRFELDEAASMVFLDLWAAGGVPLKGEGTTLDFAEYIFGDPQRSAVIDRNEELARYRDSERTAGRRGSVVALCRAVRITRTAFYESWLTGRWADTSQEAFRIRAHYSGCVIQGQNGAPKLPDTSGILSDSLSLVGDTFSP